MQFSWVGQNEDEQSQAAIGDEITQKMLSVSFVLRCEHLGVLKSAPGKDTVGINHYFACFYFAFLPEERSGRSFSRFRHRLRGNTAWKPSAMEVQCIAKTVSRRLLLHVFMKSFADTNVYRWWSRSVQKNGSVCVWRYDDVNECIPTLSNARVDYK